MNNGTTDKAKGRVKEAVGVLTGDASLRREGKLDQAAGAVKDTAAKAKKAAVRAVDKVRDAVARKR